MDPARSARPAAFGLAGLGLVGRAMAGRLCAAGHGVAAFDPDAQAWAETGALPSALMRTESLPALAAASEIVVVAVLDDAQLLAVVDAVCTAPARPALLLSCVTCSPGAADAAAARCAQAGLAFADMPLSGSAAQIGQGQALGLLGADAAVWPAHGQALQALCPRIRHVGAAGSGSRAKLASNLVLGLNRAALAEGLALAGALGLDAAEFLDLLRESPAYSRAVDVAGPRMLARDFKPGSRIRQHRKDVALMLAEAQRFGLALPLTQGHADLMDQALALGLGEHDNTALMLALQLRAGNASKDPR